MQREFSLVGVWGYPQVKKYPRIGGLGELIDTMSAVTEYAQVYQALSRDNYLSCRANLCIPHTPEVFPTSP
jgi:hypothetical protein